MWDMWREVDTVSWWQPHIMNSRYMSLIRTGQKKLMLCEMNAKHLLSDLLSMFKMPLAQEADRTDF
jgi:hypothetical protein